MIMSYRQALAIFKNPSSPKMINPINCPIFLRPATFIVPLVLLVLSSQNIFALGEPGYVETSSTPNNFALCDGQVAPILVDTNDWPGVARAAGDLAADTDRVTGHHPKVLNQLKSAGKNVVIVGTIGKSEFIDRLILEKKIDASEITGKWESFFIQIVPSRFPALTMRWSFAAATSAARSTASTICPSRWAFRPGITGPTFRAKHHDRLFVKAGRFVQGPPSVKYRGIFLNDEAPDLTRLGPREIRQRVPAMPGAANYGPRFLHQPLRTDAAAHGQLSLAGDVEQRLQRR